jgi:hypothetical protein
MLRLLVRVCATLGAIGRWLFEGVAILCGVVDRVLSVGRVSPAFLLRRETAFHGITLAMPQPLVTPVACLIGD